MDFFDVALSLGAKDYMGCVVAAQSIKMMYKVDPIIYGQVIKAFLPEKNNKDAIRLTSVNLRQAIKKAYSSLSYKEKGLSKAALTDFIKNGLKMPVLGRLEVCSKQEREEIEGLIQEEA